MKGLTVKQRNIVDFIEDFMESMGMAPTIYEIAEHFKIKTSTVFAHIRALQKKSVLQRSSKARSISLNKPRKKRRMPSGVHAVPLVDSILQNKLPAPAGALICDSKVFSKTIGGKDVFAMRVNGSGMEKMGIFAGDMILVKSRPGNISKGDILLTLEDGKPVLRTCGKCEDGVFELQNSNSAKRTIVGKQDEFPLRGVVIGLQRSF